MPLPASDAAGGELAAGRAGGQSARGQTGGQHMRRCARQEERGPVVARRGAAGEANMACPCRGGFNCPGFVLACKQIPSREAKPRVFKNGVD